MATRHSGIVNCRPDHALRSAADGRVSQQTRRGKAPACLCSFLSLPVSPTPVGRRTSAAKTGRQETGRQGL
ncbi:uncharacterized protein SPSK_10357 [Sporothrix schenckii 1099-18]|uniref:Uncharacterized protein n=1 Tax=Sporothrix schenckii 1099-18 TaxID=1397361 RepID=A0A0F2LZ60_SPOSC|nr:uncharacterized protein SPSK_10357 [Sporothrix schenckii 1099-18]KJR81790.1 hypothetical protein SPSK_10357 [Sporothrix schenckii 1099-18]